MCPIRPLIALSLSDTRAPTKRVSKYRSGRGGVAVTTGDGESTGGRALQVVRGWIVADTEYASAKRNRAASEYKPAGRGSGGSGRGLGGLGFRHVNGIAPCQCILNLYRTSALVAGGIPSGRTARTYRPRVSLEAGISRQNGEPGVGPGAAPSISGVCEATPRTCHCSFGAASGTSADSTRNWPVCWAPISSFLPSRVGMQGDLGHRLRDQLASQGNGLEGGNNGQHAQGQGRGHDVSRLRRKAKRLEPVRSLTAHCGSRLVVIRHLEEHGSRIRGDGQQGPARPRHIPCN